MTDDLIKSTPHGDRLTHQTRISPNAAEKVREMHYGGKTTFQVPRSLIIVRAINELYAREMENGKS